MKKKRISKKLKNSWRKHIDDNDLDVFFENKRLDERLGTPFDLRNDTELFKLDKKPASLIRDSVLSSKTQKSDISSLKCFRGLENTSAVQDPLIKRNTVRTKEQRKHPILKKKNEIRLRKGILKKKEFNQLEKYLQKRISCFKQKQKRKITVEGDIWADDTEDRSKFSNLQNWFNDTTSLHAIRNTSDLKKMSNYRPETVETIIPSFEVPHPGISYNPTFKDHLDLVNEVAKKEIEIQKKENHLNRVTQKLFRPITYEQNEKNWFQEMSAGLPYHDDDEVESMKDNQADDDDNEYKAINPPVNREKKKTKKQRKKELRLKQEELRRKDIKEQKKKALDICKVKYLMHEIIEEETKKKKRSLKRLQKSARKFEIPRRVGKNLFTSEDIPITEVTELTGSLREIIPQGNVLKDKFMNMQKRSLIEVTKPQFKIKKKKMKKYPLNSHRSEALEFSATELLKNFKR